MMEYAQKKQDKGKIETGYQSISESIQAHRIFLLLKWRPRRSSGWVGHRLCQTWQTVK